MAIADKTQLREYCLDVAKRARAASARLATLRGEVKDHWLRHSAKLLRDRQSEILAANDLDIAAAPHYGLTKAAIDRLRLTPDRIESIAAALEQIAMLRDPIGEVIESSVRPNGIEAMKVRVPLGVVFFIYESRPNVTADAAAICVKSGNAVILRGGKEALQSSQAIVTLLAEAAEATGLPADAVQLVETTDRDAVGHFLGMSEYIDLAIPRGGESLIRRVAEEATMPVIKHFDGNCHVFVDASADFDMAERITINSKCHRLGVCNAAESLLVHSAIAKEFVPKICAALKAKGVEIRGDVRARSLAMGIVPATEADYRAEFLDAIISLCIVDSLEEAIDHINRYGSKHTDAIVTSDLASARAFVAGVDSAGVFVNASTRFNDGGELGLGAEIGISTDKFHARGPCGLKELTSYKYIVWGDGQVR